MQDHSTAVSKTTFRPRVRRLGPGRYLIESRSRPGIGHQTTATACGCPAGRHGRACWHRQLVAALEPSMQGWYAQGMPARRVSSTGTSGMAALQECFG